MSDVAEIYSKIVQKRFLFIFLFLILSSLISLVNLIVGPAKLSVLEILQSLTSPSKNTASVVVWEYRLPWTLMAILVGGALGLAGLQMQTILNNPLASPYTLGISSGAGFGAALAYVLGIHIIAVPSEFIVPINAFVFLFSRAC